MAFSHLLVFRYVDYKADNLSWQHAFILPYSLGKMQELLPLTILGKGTSDHELQWKYFIFSS